MTTVAVSPRKRAGSRTAQNLHPVSIPDTMDNNPGSNGNKSSNTSTVNVGVSFNNDSNSKANIGVDGSTKQSQPPPKLVTTIFVLKLVSPDQPNEYLKVLNIPQAPQSLKIGRQNTPKTTNKITDGFFDSRVLSRNHAELFVKDKLLYIRDLKSSNGTFINDTKLEPYEDYKLNINDKIDLGTTLESQMAHRKITCIVKEFHQISLKNFQELVDEIINKDDMISQKLELFNSTLDALLFGEIVDDIAIGGDSMNDDLMSLIGDNIDEDTENSGEPLRKGMIRKSDVSQIKFKSGLDLKTQDPQEIIKKLIVTVNNEYIQQQRLKAMNNFLKNYNNSVAGYESTSIFRLYDKLLRSSQNSISTRNDEDKYHKMEDQVRKFQHELEIVRRHLCTAQAKEKEMTAKQLENEELRKSLEESQTVINRLELELQKTRESYDAVHKQLKEMEENERISELAVREAQIKTNISNTEDIMLSEDTSDTDEAAQTSSETRNPANVSSSVLQYGGVAVFCLVVMWYL